jgi:hypothetical protein
MPTDGRLISSIDLLYFLDHISLFYLGCEFPKSRCYFLGHWFCNLNISLISFAIINNGAYIGRSVNSVSLKI